MANSVSGWAFHHYSRAPLEIRDMRTAASYLRRRSPRR
jgi:hypothetical protein